MDGDRYSAPLLSSPLSERSRDRRQRLDNPKRRFERNQNRRSRSEHDDNCSNQTSSRDSSEMSRSRSNHRLGQVERETDPQTLARREKQIEFGKNTLAYDQYTKAVPKTQRQKGQPRTPNKYDKFSRRQWDGLVKAWKRRLHSWDNPSRDSQSEPVSENETSFDWSQDVEEEKAKEDDTGMMEDDVGGRAKFWSERKFFKSGDENVNTN